MREETKRRAFADRITGGAVYRGGDADSATKPTTVEPEAKQEESGRRDGRKGVWGGGGEERTAAGKYAAAESVWQRRACDAEKNARQRRARGAESGGRATPKKRAAMKEPPHRRMRSEKIRRKTRGTREQKHGDALRRGDTDKTAARGYGQNEITEAPGKPGASVIVDNDVQGFITPRRVSGTECRAP